MRAKTKLLIATGVDTLIESIHILPVVSTHTGSKTVALLQTLSIDTLLLIAGHQNTSVDATRWVTSARESRDRTKVQGDRYMGVLEVITVTNWLCMAISNEDMSETAKPNASEVLRLIGIENAVKSFLVDIEGEKRDGWAVVRLGFLIEKLEWLMEDDVSERALHFAIGPTDSFNLIEVHRCSHCSTWLPTSKSTEESSPSQEIPFSQSDLFPLSLKAYNANKLALVFTHALDRPTRVKSTEDMATGERLRELLTRRTSSEAALTVEEITGIRKGLYPKEPSGHVEMLTGHFGKTIE
ncbi:hypothetical protein HDU93_007723 [Gonapodya sp. JEL0774]|nr:hypothetical protein HDU93_007723 [Gonapodya sp. JEL0774]